MAEAVLLCLAGFATFLGMIWFALSLDVHWRQVMAPDSRAAAPAPVLRLAGAVALATSFAFCLAADHTSMAVLVWIMFLAVSAVTVTMMLASKPQCLRLAALPWSINQLRATR